MFIILFSVVSTDLLSLLLSFMRYLHFFLSFLFFCHTPATTHSEILCNCSSDFEGISHPDDCDKSTGQCSCVKGYTGLQCEDCEEDYFTNGTSGCQPCSCDSYGAVNHLCDR